VSGISAFGNRTFNQLVFILRIKTIILSISCIYITHNAKAIRHHHVLLYRGYKELVKSGIQMSIALKKMILFDIPIHVSIDL
jgi:hypothetical protein